MGRQRESKVDYWLKPDKIELLKCYARDFTLADIARKIGISYKVFCEWRKKYPAINEAIEEGKETVDYQVENALLKTALGGYKVKEVKTIISPPDKNGNRKIRVEELVKEMPPNTTAIMCWLNNRKPDNWKRNRDQFKIEDKENSNITVNIIRKDAQNDDSEEWEVNAQENKTNSANKSKAKQSASAQDSTEEEWDALEWDDE